MAVDPAKIREMMIGKGLNKTDIKKMADMVRNAEDPETRKQVMKHSVFFAGQLPLQADYAVDKDRTRKILLASIPYDEVDEYMDDLLDSLATQKLLLKDDKGNYKVNTKYENSVAKAMKVARAYQADQAASGADREDIKKLYQTATKYYNSGQMMEAAASFHKAVELCGHRMAAYSLAMMYTEGRGVEKNLKKAAYYAANSLMKGAKIAEPMMDRILSELDSGK